MASESELVRINWKNQGPAVLGLMDFLFQSQMLVDCTLSGTESSYRVHKLLLSSCSPYFEKLILEAPPDSHPILVMDATDEDLQALIQYLYRGYTDLPKENVNKFLEVTVKANFQGYDSVSSNPTQIELEGESLFSSNLQTKPSNLANNTSDENVEIMDLTSPCLSDEDQVDTNDLEPSDKRNKRKKGVAHPPRRKRKLSSIQHFVSLVSQFNEKVNNRSNASNSEQSITSSSTIADRIPTMKHCNEAKTRVVSVERIASPRIPNNIHSETKQVPKLFEKSTPEATPTSTDDDVVMVENKNEIFVIDDDDNDKDCDDDNDKDSDDDNDEDIDGDDLVLESNGNNGTKGDVESQEPEKLSQGIFKFANSSTLAEFRQNVQKLVPLTESGDTVFCEMDNVIQALPDGRYRCMLCSFIRPTLSLIEIHVTAKHLKNLQSNSEAPKVNLIKAFVCRWCNEKFHTHRSYKDHTSIKHANAPVDNFNLVCTFCGQLLENLESYRKHALEAHNKSTQIVSLFCGRCGEKTNNSPFHTKVICDLMRLGKMPHKEVIKSNADVKTQIMCDKCLKVFKEWKDFKKHYTMGCLGL